MYSARTRVLALRPLRVPTHRRPRSAPSPAPHPAALAHAASHPFLFRPSCLAQSRHALPRPPLSYTWLPYRARRAVPTRTSLPARPHVNICPTEGCTLHPLFCRSQQGAGACTNRAWQPD